MAQGDGSRILLIDEDPRFGKDVVARLEAAGLDASFHRGPSGTLGAVLASRCQVVVIDVKMRKINGDLVVRMLRDAFGLGRSRVILCSDLSPNALAALAEDLQVTSVAKSEGVDVLIERIRAALPSPARVAPERPAARRSARN